MTNLQQSKPSSPRGRIAGMSAAVSTNAAAFTLLAAMLAVTPLPNFAADALPTNRAQEQIAGKPFSAMATAEPVAQTLRTGRSSGVPVELADLPHEGPTQPMAWDDLRRTLDSLDRWLAVYEARPSDEPAFGQFGPSIRVGGLPVFNLDRFEDNLNDAFGQQTVGYQYAIARDGLLARSSVFGTTGLARTNANPPNTSQVATKEMNLASVSKTITATVLLRLLDERNVSVDSLIAPSLPANWVLGAGIGLVPGPRQLSFRELLTHRSGLNANLNTAYRYADLQGYAAAGIVGASECRCNPAHKG